MNNNVLMSLLLFLIGVLIGYYICSKKVFMDKNVLITNPAAW